jgi:hypothetical protein
MTRIAVQKAAPARGAAGDAWWCDGQAANRALAFGDCALAGNACLVLTCSMIIESTLPRKIHSRQSPCLVMQSMVLRKASSCAL